MKAHFPGKGTAVGPFLAAMRHFRKKPI